MRKDDFDDPGPHHEAFMMRHMSFEYHEPLCGECEESDDGPCDAHMDDGEHL